MGGEFEEPIRPMSLAPYITAMGLSNPPFAITQARYSEFAIEALQIPAGGIQDKIKELGERSGIDTRYFCRNDMNLPREQWTSLPKDWPKSAVGMTRRNEIYCQEAPRLSLEAARKAISQWGGDVSEITHVIAASCTGVMAPGIETHLMMELGLRTTVERFGLNLMGCFAAFRSLSMAKAFVDQNPVKHKVLVVCCELCSIHFRAEMSFETFIGNALFADGAAALVVEGLTEKQAAERPVTAVQICRFASQIVEKSLEQMTWRASDDGFVFKLSPQIPSSLQKAAPEFVRRIADGVCSVDDLDYAIHPGGRKIIEDLETALNLPVAGPKTSASWHVLKHYGNMSSVTFLFVLAEKLRQRSASDSEPNDSLKYICGMGFGPGLSLEGVLLKVD